MVLDKMFSQNVAIGAAMQATILRNEVINNNIANNDVPGYKKKTVEFESILDSALNSAGSINDLDLDKVKPRIKEIHSGFNYRLDENNVDVETEMVDLYQNSIRYDTMVTSTISNTSRINLVLNGR